jgi:hypothetical protein
VHGDAVAAQERERVVRRGTDDGDALAPPGIEGQNALVLEHHRRPARDFAGQLDGARRLQRGRSLPDVGLLDEAQSSGSSSMSRPGAECHRRPISGEVVVLVQEADAVVVGHDQPVEAPLGAQHLGEEVARRMAGPVVDVVVRPA